MNDENKGVEEVKLKTVADTEKNKPEKEKEQDLKKWKFFLLGIGLLIVLVGIFGIVLSVRAVRNLSESPIVLKVAEVLNLSVARVNSSAIPYILYIDDLQTLKRFYEKAPEGSVPSFTDEEISDQALSRLIVNTIIKDLARDFKVAITEEDIDEIKEELFAPYSDETAVEAELSEQYGWDIDTYIKKIIRPLVLEQKVTEAFSAGETGDVGADYELGEEIKARHILFRVEGEDEDDAQVMVQAEEVLERIKNGEDFAELAAEFGSDATKDNGGDLGWFEGDWSLC